jgi:hypothetical protein
MEEDGTIWSGDVMKRKARTPQKKFEPQLSTLSTPTLKTELIWI